VEIKDFDSVGPEDFPDHDNTWQTYANNVRDLMANAGGFDKIDCDVNTCYELPKVLNIF
jgi:hypothetical protein